MLKMVISRLFLFITFISMPAGFLLANTAGIERDEGYDVMTENVVCVPAVRDGRVLFSDKQAYAQFSEHLKAAGFNPQVVPFKKLQESLLNSDSNEERERIICKDLIFLFLEGFAVFQEEFNVN